MNIDDTTTFEHVLNQYSFQHPESPLILDVGCGTCSEAELLLNRYGGRLIGVDNDFYKIMQAREQHNGMSIFTYGDARNLARIVAEPADIIIARRPLVLGNNWKHIFQECYKAAREGAVLISSFYQQIEQEIARLMMRRAGFSIASEGRIKENVQADVGAIVTGPDSFYIFALKTGEAPKQDVWSEARYAGDSMMLMRKYRKALFG